MARAKPVYGIDAMAETRYSLPAIFSARIAELWSWSPHIRDAANVQQLHDMRIAAKRLRYCFEFFSPLFAKGFKGTLDTFKKLQDFLGEIHDSDVWVDYLRGELDDAFSRLTRSHNKLDRHIGASDGLLADARKMAQLCSEGPVQGLLLMLDEVCQRRRRLYTDFVAFWDELEGRDFRGELLQAVSSATLARPRQAEIATESAPSASESADTGNNAPVQTEAEPQASASAPAGEEANLAPESWPT